MVAEVLKRYRVGIAGAMLFAAGTAACASLQSVSSGQIGCPEEDIVITRDEVGWSSRTWTAECHVKRFFCTAVQTGKNESQVNCKEETANPSSEATEPAARPTPKPVASGCQYDTQCKGDRVCVKGACVAPTPPSPAQAPAEPAAPAAP
jgi:hypothetical protein